MTVETCSLVHINTYKLNNQSRVDGDIYSFQTLSISFIVLLVFNNIQKQQQCPVWTHSYPGNATQANYKTACYWNHVLYERR